MNSASSAPIKPRTSATVSARRGDGSLTRCGAISTPAANPTAATHSQNNFRPNNRITAPISAPTIATEKCIEGSWRAMLESVYGKRLFIGFQRSAQAKLTLRPRFEFRYSDFGHENRAGGI